MRILNEPLWEAIHRILKPLETQLQKPPTKDNNLRKPDTSFEALVWSVSGTFNSSVWQTSCQIENKQAAANKIRSD